MYLFCKKVVSLVLVILFLCGTLVFGDDAIQQKENQAQNADGADAAILAVSEIQKDEAQQFYDEVEKIVKNRLSSYYKKDGKGTLGVYIKELNTGFDYGYNAEKINPANSKEGFFYAASTCKLLASAVIYYLDNNEVLELNKVYTDSLTKEKYNLKKLIYKMITHSVNSYFNRTLRLLGRERINDTLCLLDVKHSFVYSEIMPDPNASIKGNLKRYGMSRSPRTTPKDLGHILDILYKEETFGASNSAYFADSLKHNIYTNRLPQGVGFRSAVGHKTGTSINEGVYNDAGIVYLKGNPYIIVLMSKGSPSDVQVLERQIAKDIYNYMAKRIAE